MSEHVMTFEEWWDRERPEFPAKDVQKWAPLWEFVFHEFAGARVGWDARGEDPSGYTYQEGEVIRAVRDWAFGDGPIGAILDTITALDSHEHPVTPDLVPEVAAVIAAARAVEELWREGHDPFDEMEELRDALDAAQGKEKAQ